MTYTKKQFFEHVTKEATALKEHATKEEIEKLDFDRLDPNNYELCIYGQITGDCMSKRASNLINLCCRKFFVNDDKCAIDKKGFKEVKRVANGETVDHLEKERKQRDLKHFSAIETYILTPNAKNKNLIDFIKGVKEKLVL